MSLKIAVIGSGLGDKEEVLKKSREIGKEIAKNKCILVTGGCRGYPYAAVVGAKKEKGKTIAISPAENEEEHVNVYGFPTDQTEIIYTGLGIPGRNKEVILNSDAVIIIGGNGGTLNELTFALYEERPLGVLKGSGGITDIVHLIAERCDRKGEKERIVYSENPKELVKELVKLL